MNPATLNADERWLRADPARKLSSERSLAYIQALRDARAERDALAKALMEINERLRRSG